MGGRRVLGTRRVSIKWLWPVRYGNSFPYGYAYAVLSLRIRFGYRLHVREPAQGGRFNNARSGTDAWQGGIPLICFALKKRDHLAVAFLVDQAESWLWILVPQGEAGFEGIASCMLISVEMLEMRFNDCSIRFVIEFWPIFRTMAWLEVFKLLVRWLNLYICFYFFGIIIGNSTLLWGYSLNEDGEKEERTIHLK